MFLFYVYDTYNIVNVYFLKGVDHLVRCIFRYCEIGWYAMDMFSEKT